MRSSSSPDNTQILIDATTVDGQMKVSVTDYGIGVKPRDREKIFQRFYRADNEKTGYVCRDSV